MAPGPGRQAWRLRGSTRFTARIHSRRCAASTGNLRYTEREEEKKARAGGGCLRRPGGVRGAAAGDDRTHWWKEMPRSRLRPLSRAVQPSAEQLRVMADPQPPPRTAATPRHATPRPGTESARPLAATARPPSFLLPIGSRATTPSLPVGSSFSIGCGGRCCSSWGSAAVPPRFDVSKEADGGNGKGTEPTGSGGRGRSSQ